MNYELESNYKIDLFLLKSIEDLQQSRTDFQLKYFVINQHPTDEMKYKQCLLEIQSLYFSLSNLDLDIESEIIKKDRLSSSNDELDLIETKKINLKLQQNKLSRLGMLRELDSLLVILNSFDKHYTKEEIETNQEQYWKIRLMKEYEIENISRSPSQASIIKTLIDLDELQYVPTEVTNLDDKKGEIE